MKTKELSSEPKRKYNRKDTRKYWYFIQTRECVLCGAGGIHRERRYTPRPEDWKERYEYEQFVCGNHF